MDADIIVVGGGLAGLVASAELADAGRSVILLDQEPEQSLGGQAFEKQRREPARLLEVLRVRPLAIVELDRDAIAEVLRIAPQQRRRIRCDERRFSGRGNGPRRET